MQVRIIGAGPVGSYAGIQLSKEHDVTIYEQKKSLTIKHSGLFSTNLKNLYKPPKETILNKIKGAKIISPNGEFIEIGGSKTRALVTDTILFDKSLINKAKDKGVTIKTGKKINTVTKKDNRVLIDDDIKAQYLIDASGPNSVVRKSFGLKQLKTYTGIETIAKYPSYPEDSVEIYLGNNIAPNFFAWTIPLGDGRAKIGLITENNPAEYFKTFLKRLGVNKHEEVSGGIIPVDTAKDFIVNNRISLIGDAAAHTKATTGGGIVTGFESVNLLANELNKEEPDFNNYYNTWKKGVGKELNYHHRIRKFYNKLSDNDINELVKKAEEFKPIIEEHGDMDYPSHFLKPLMKNKEFLKLGLKHGFKLF